MKYYNVVVWWYDILFTTFSSLNCPPNVMTHLGKFRRKRENPLQKNGRIRLRGAQIQNCQNSKFWKFKKWWLAPVCLIFPNVPFEWAQTLKIWKCIFLFEMSSCLFICFCRRCLSFVALFMTLACSVLLLSNMWPALLVLFCFVVLEISSFLVQLSFADIRCKLLIFTF